MSTPRHDHQAAPDPVLREVSAGVWAYVQPDGSWGLNNAGFFVSGDGVTLIDTCFTERRTRALLDAVASVTDQPVRTLVNTHHHGDHTHGNWLVAGATIIGHTLCRQAVLAAGHASTGLFPDVDWGEIHITPPFVTFDHRLSVHADDLEIELVHMGPAHTTNDVVAWVPSRRLLLAGDLVFHGGTPFVVMGSVTGSIEAVARLQELGAGTVVPGHGDVCGPEVLDDQLRYLRWVRGLAEEAVAAGQTALEAARRADLGEFAAWHDRERLVGNLHRGMAEVRGAAPGAGLDIREAIADMITYNGGRPLRCLA